MTQTLSPSSSRPTLSVILPVYNNSVFLEKSVQSVLNQTFEAFELIIVDDCSTDETPKLIAQLATTDDRIRVLRTPQNGGSAQARNLGLDHARADLIAAMDSDDIAHPLRFEKQIEAMTRRNKAVLCSTSLRRITGSGRVSSAHVIDYTPQEYRWCIAFNLRITHSSLMFRATLPDGTPTRYNGDFRQSQDHELVSRLTRHGDVICLPDILVDYRVHDAQVTGTQRRPQQELSLQISRSHQANRLPSDICAALEPINQALFNDRFDFPEITRGLQIYAQYLAPEEGLRPHGFDRLAAVELHYLLTRNGRSQRQALAAMTNLAPAWIPLVMAEKLRKLRSKQRQLKMLQTAG